MNDPHEDPQPAAVRGLARPELSVVVPVYRNRATLVVLLDRLDATLGDLEREYVFVVDGCPDDSHELLLEEQRRRPWLVVVDLARNCGQHAALAAGFEVSRGRAVAVMDADLQQDPEELPRFLEPWRAGHDFVSGWRVTRSDPLDRKLGSLALNWLVRRITGVALHDWGCPLAVIDRSVIERVADGGEQRRFLKPLVAKLSRRPTELRIEGRERVDGKSSYSSLALLGVTLDFAVSFANRPFLKLIGLGAVGTGAGIGIGVVYLGLRIAGVVGQSPPVVALAALGLLLGAQVLILGAMGEFTHRIYRLVQGQPLFEIRDVRRSEEASESRIAAHS